MRELGHSADESCSSNWKFQVRKILPCDQRFDLSTSNLVMFTYAWLTLILGVLLQKPIVLHVFWGSCEKSNQMMNWLDTYSNSNNGRVLVNFNIIIPHFTLNKLNFCNTRSMSWCSGCMFGGGGGSNLRKFWGKSSDFAQNLGQNWDDWYMTGCIFFLKNWYLYGFSFKFCVAHSYQTRHTWVPPTLGLHV